ncbi:hypothetical protein HAX54_031584 [Datura stramonium]|uniref:RNase H type-1 domain-containing protein n=1 Tax=Datura stramonium TaxID=4076 RepID=A0ABS8RLN6_DATST|nr:hypothetical protein [Datura stramonium]
MTFNGEICEPNEIINKALFDFHEYENNLATKNCAHTLGTSCTDDRSIIMAQDGFVMFADDVLQNEKKMASIGVAAMNNCSNLLQALAFMTAEALTIRKALENAMKNGWSKVQILSDGRNVVDMILKKSEVSWEIETTCEDI